MKTTFDLPDPLLRKAKAAAADQGRPLRDLVAEALAEKLAALALAKGARRSRDSEWKAFEAGLQKQPDGSYVNPEIPEDDKFAEILEALRAERLAWQPRNPFEGIDFSEENDASGTPPPTPDKG
ncbi:MAG: hypothetical protein ABIN44_08380 [Burkholderiaceae bacterium]